MRRIGAALLLSALLLSGCHSAETCTHPDTGVSIGSYVEALGDVKKNLKTLKGDHEEALEKADYVDELKEAELGLYDATISLCNDALVGAAKKPVEPEGGDQ